jgi:hypothetical protein
MAFNMLLCDRFSNPFTVPTLELSTEQITLAVKNHFNIFHTVKQKC